MSKRRLSHPRRIMGERFASGDLVYTEDVPMEDSYMRRGGAAMVIEDGGGYQVRIAYLSDGASFILPRELVHRERRNTWTPQEDTEV